MYFGRNHALRAGQPVQLLRLLHDSVEHDPHNRGGDRRYRRIHAQGPQARWIVALRILATVCMVIVGVVYAALLAPLGLEGGAPVPWANWVMHYAGPILVAID